MNRFIVALFGLSLCASVEAQLLNGSFEQGNWTPEGNWEFLDVASTKINGWSIVAGPVLWGRETLLPAANGSLFVELTRTDNSPPFGGLEQTFNTVPGGNYVVSFSLGSQGLNNGSRRLDLSFGGTKVELAGVQNSQDFQWETLERTFTASDASTTLRFAGIDDGTGTFILGLDNISVTQVPEPATCALLIVGFAPLIFRKSRLAAR
jgi:hypothetical protein